MREIPNDQRLRRRVQESKTRVLCNVFYLSVEGIPTTVLSKVYFYLYAIQAVFALPPKCGPGKYCTVSPIFLVARVYKPSLESMSAISK